MGGFDDLFGVPGGSTNDWAEKLFGKSKSGLPTCTNGHTYGSNGVCHKCGGKNPDPPAKKKLSTRIKRVDGVAYVHATDVAALLEANHVQPTLAANLRALNEGKS